MAKISTKKVYSVIDQRVYFVFQGKSSGLTLGYLFIQKGWNVQKETERILEAKERAFEHTRPVAGHGCNRRYAGMPQVGGTDRWITGMLGDAFEEPDTVSVILAA